MGGMTMVMTEGGAVCVIKYRLQDQTQTHIRPFRSGAKNWIEKPGAFSFIQVWEQMQINKYAKNEIWILKTFNLI